MWSGDKGLVYKSIHPRLRLIFISLGLMTILGIGIWLAPYPLGLYYQLRGGQLLEKVLTANTNIAGSITCELEPLSGENDRIQITQAVSLLQRAIDYNRDGSQAYLLLGQARCLLGESELAIEAFNVFTDLRPENPLGHLELGLAYFASCKSDKYIDSDDPTVPHSLDGHECKDPTLQTLVVRELASGGTGFDQLIINGRSAIFNKRFDVAAEYFEMASYFDQRLSRADIFSWSLASIISNGELPIYEGTNPMQASILNGNLEVDARNLLWFREGNMHGQYLSNFPGGDPNSGFLWWNGSAVTVIDVLKPANYHIILSAQNTPPAPIKLQIDHNFVPIKTFELTREDNSWDEIETSIYLDKGLHIIGITFLNDEILGDINRNAVISSIRLQN